ncbi:MAG: formylglycine-generating enzyme family protein [SAR324 cluster bacterium]|nr:formylglycine-generating enzyme family protein [SAR324 cluster bacterium]MCH8886245.1 formylglycine-generating enzyme family protein [SAR324 cluster bacterium]
MKHSGALLIAAILVLSSNGLPMAQDNRPAAPSALPREIQADRFLLKARKAYTKKDWKTASEFFAKIQNLETEIPHDFHYFYGKTLRNQRDLAAAKVEIVKYLQKARRDGKYYTAALEVLNEIEDAEKRPWKDRVTGMEFIKVGGGKFQMGCHRGNKGECNPDEKPVREVTLKTFWIGKYEVTQRQWKRIMKRNPSRIKKGNKFPVEGVSWKDIQSFLRRLNARSRNKFSLPSEAQWEYACRGGDTTMKFGTADGKLTRKNANFGTEKCCQGDNRDGHLPTAPVGSYASNSLGLYDMTGNVWEWVQDKYTFYNRVEKKDPVYQSKSLYEHQGDTRVVRGGSWYRGTFFARCSMRSIRMVNDKSHDMGFRLVRIDAEAWKKKRMEDRKRRRGSRRN